MKISLNNFLVVILILSTTLNAYSQTENDSKAIKQTIEKFFEGLESGDTLRIAETISNDIKLQSTFINQNGDNVIRTSTRSEFFNLIAKKNVNDVWEEKLLRFEIQADSLLASVWTPYEFYLNGEFSHCGTNSFQLVKNKNAWLIVYLIDSRKRTGCKPKN